jgi:hypothetical protein
MAAPFLMALHGQLTVIGKSPDGDSMRFIPHSPDALEELARRSHPRDQKRRQRPAALARHRHSRDALRALRAAAGATSRATGCWSTPASRTSRLTRRARSPQRRRRPVRRWCSARPLIPTVARSPICSSITTTRHRTVSSAEVDAELLRSSVNAASLAEGVAYLTLYSSTPARHRRTLLAIAADASEQQLGVWGPDETDNFD